jgi:hypothetical protein
VLTAIVRVHNALATALIAFTKSVEPGHKQKEVSVKSIRDSSPGIRISSFPFFKEGLKAGALKPKHEIKASWFKEYLPNVNSQLRMLREITIEEYGSPFNPSPEWQQFLSMQDCVSFIQK